MFVLGASRYRKEEWDIERKRDSFKDVLTIPNDDNNNNMKLKHLRVMSL